MADKKISQLSSASALTGAEPLAIVQDGVTKKTTVQDVANLSSLGTVTFEAEGAASYQDDTLEGKMVLMVFTDSAVRVPSDYTFTSSTGTIVFASAIDQDTIIQIIYK